MGNEITTGRAIPNRGGQREQSTQVPESDRETASLPSTQVIPKGIVIVSKGTDGDSDVKFTFPPLFKPLIPIGYETIPPAVPQINPRQFLNFGQLIQNQLSSKAYTVSQKQTILCDTIRDTECQSIFLAGALLAEPSRQFSEVAKNFSKLSEIDALVIKIENEATVCIRRLKSINSSLPQHLQLEAFTYASDS